ncbi:MAG TPA: tRNA1(Val) (adenine(37)-N6)-methyltransferase [Candidatus Limiplasma sp.]|mgnify:CR=1 FL=1|nr:tRNA1(Val) (adenine(37)-N6)-methyltransferase [Candidatus Limiplasma sp.]HPS82033.1 tRNA1(Val) (adenine(37)-N6)-methyltransferase [Candidatus Limiplasma sp.]
MHSEQNATPRADERLDDLQTNGLRILQKPACFCFGMDAVLLAHFTRLRPRDRIADLGTGTGILPILMSQTEPTACFEAFEWQPDMADMAQRSVALNGLEHRITIHAEDLRNAPDRIGRGSVHGVVCNPPYGKQGGVILSQTEEQLLARHEKDCTLADILRAGAAILRNQGRLWMSFPSARMLELTDSLRENRLEPKQIRMVCAKASKAPYLLLMEAVKNAKPMLTWLPPLIVYHEDSTETDELKAIYAGRLRPGQS